MNQLRHSLATRLLIRLLGNGIALVGRGNRLCVVNYHRILEQPDAMLDSEPDVATFRWQMALLAQCFNVLPLADALKALDAGTLPPRALCITFDDGYRSVHDLALPVLREFGLPATAFVTSGFVGNALGNMWNDRIMHAVQSLPDEELDLSSLQLGRYPTTSQASRRETAHRLVEAGKYLAPAARHALVSHLDTLTGIDSAALMMTTEMLRTLHSNAVEIGAHTVSHPILTSLDDASAREEIVNGKTELEAMIGIPVRLFAYPNGKVGKDYDERHVAMVREAGFLAGFTTAVGAITAQQDRFQLPRSRPWDRTPLGFGLRLLSWIAMGYEEKK